MLSFMLFALCICTIPLLFDSSSYHRHYLAYWIDCVAAGLSYCRICLAIMLYGYIAWLWRKEEGRDSARIAMYRSHLLLYCKFSTSRNPKETLAKFFRNP